MSYPPSDGPSDQTASPFEPPPGSEQAFTGDPGPSWSSPPVGQPSAPVKQLVRDPYTKLGGVASGLSHHTGLDVSLIRLAFVISTFISGAGLLLYLLGWLIIPRARFWPPEGSMTPTRALSTREIAIGLLLIGIVVGMFVNGGPFSAVLVPVVLVAVGIWLLVQPDAGDTTNGGTGRPGFAAGPSAMGTARQVDSRWFEPPQFDTQQFDTQQTGFTQTQSPHVPPHTPTGMPVQPRSRRRRFFVFGLVATAILVPLLIIGGLIAALFASGVIADPGFTATYQPTTVEDIPTDIDHNQGRITLDLSLLSVSDFDGPVEIDMNLDFGEAVVILPEGVETQVRAESGVGDVQVFDESASGVDPDIFLKADGAEIVLDVSVGVGKVTVDGR